MSEIQRIIDESLEYYKNNNIEAIIYSWHNNSDSIEYAFHEGWHNVCEKHKVVWANINYIISSANIRTREDITVVRGVFYVLDEKIYLISTTLDDGGKIIIPKGTKVFVTPIMEEWSEQELLIKPKNWCMCDSSDLTKL